MLFGGYQFKHDYSVFDQNIRLSKEVSIRVLLSFSSCKRRKKNKTKGGHKTKGTFQLLLFLLGQVTKPILRPRKTRLVQGPSLLPLVLASGARNDVNRHQVVHPRMRLLCIRSLCDLAHLFLPHRRIGLGRLLERIVKRNSIGKRLGPAGGEPHVPQVVDRHSRPDDDDALVAERRHGPAEPVMRIRVLRVEERDLHQRAAERVGLGREGDVEARKDSVVEAALEPPRGDPGLGEQRDDSGSELGGSGRGESGLVELGGEPVKVVDEVGEDRVVEVDLVGRGGLPVGGEDHDGFGFDLLGDFLADALEDRVDRVGGVVLDVRLGGRNFVLVRPGGGGLLGGGVMKKRGNKKPKTYAAVRKEVNWCSGHDG